MNENLLENLKKEKEKLAVLENSKINIEKKIKKSKIKIAQYTLSSNSEYYESLSDAIANTGIEFNDIVSAISSGNVSTLQEKLNNSSGE